jgi:hypothetical protein
MNSKSKSVCRSYAAYICATIAILLEGLER